MIYVMVSAENRQQAESIQKLLLEKNLAAGASIIDTPSKFWWKGEITDMDDYCYVQAFTVEKNKSRIISEAEKISEEEVPMIFFFKAETNKKFSEWLHDTLK